MVVSIMGMHRSGTSMVARALNLCGIYLGEEEDFFPATSSNTEGHWEHLKIMELNMRLLESLGARSWNAIPHLDPGWQYSAGLEDLKAEAAAFVDLTFSGKKCWGWKDPRTSITLPFWREVVPNVKSVICVRNPLDVAGSLRKRDEMPLEQALHLWHLYTESALLNSTPHDWVVVFYEDFFHDYRAALQPVLEMLGLPPVVPGSPADRAMGQFIDSSLSHHQHTPEESIESPELFARTKLLYQALRTRPDEIARIFAYRALEDDMPAPSLHTLEFAQGISSTEGTTSTPVATPAPQFGGISETMRWLAHLEREIGIREQQVTDLSAHCDSLTTQHDEMQLRLSEQGKILTDRDQEIAVLREQLSSTRAQLSSTCAQLDELRVEKEQRARIAELETTLEQQAHSSADYQSSISDLEWRLEHPGLRLLVRAAVPKWIRRSVHQRLTAQK